MTKALHKKSGKPDGLGCNETSGRVPVAPKRGKISFCAQVTTVLLILQDPYYEPLRRPVLKTRIKTLNADDL